MKLYSISIKRLSRLAIVMSLAGLVWLSFIIVTNFTVKSTAMPIAAASAPLESSLSTSPAYWQAANPVASAFINAVPGADGTEVFIAVEGVSSGSPIFLNLDPKNGPAGHRGGYAMTLSSTTYVATAIGFAPGQDVGSDGDDTMSLTTTVGSQVVGTGEINFQRAFVEPTQPEMISIDNGNFILELLNTGSVLADTYVMIMSTNAPPGPLPPGYQLASKSYNIRPSGSLTESQKFMTINLHFNEPLPGSSDPHTLTIMRWEPLNRVWEDVGGSLLNDSNTVSLPVKRFGIYALATAPQWRDSFTEASLSGVSALSQTQRGPGQTIILDNATAGTVTSIPITPVNGDVWGMLHFSATIPASTNLTVDVLDLNNNVVLANAGDGADLNSAGVDLAIYPSLKLRGNLSAVSPGLSPQLHEWSLAWAVVERRVYLPMVIK